MAVSVRSGDGPGERLVSLDVFRGLTILTMIFVNEVAGISNIPAWMKHAPEGSNAMTFVDVVFPAFLFIVGMSIPPAFERRAARGEPLTRIFRHVIVRTASLLAIGIYMVNIPRYRADLAGLSKHAWVLLMFLGVILVWNAYPRTDGLVRWLLRGLRLAGLALLVVLAVIYRGGHGEEVTWMRTSWWGILGLIGWAYLIASISYLPFRGQVAVPIGMVALLTAVFVGDKSGALGFLGSVHQYVNVGGHWGGHGSITVAGLILGMLLLRDSRAQSVSQRIRWIFLFGLGLSAGGFLLRPLYGISKVEATPAWCLYSAGLCCFAFAFLYWLVDVKGIRGWSFFLRPAGANPLLAYILPSIVHSGLALLGIQYLNTHFNNGLQGIVRSVVFAMVMMAVTGVLCRLRVRLRL